MAISNSYGRVLGDDLLGQIAEGAFTETYQKDYTHASKLFRSDNMALMPRQKFLFHVFFTLRDPSQMDEIIKNNDIGLIGALVKSITLPSFSLDTEEYVQYNRKRLVHNRIKYNPVTVTFHDDSNDVIRSLWAKYYQYHFADSSYQYDEGIPNGPGGALAGRTNYNGRDIYSEVRKNQAAGWGKTIRYGDEDGRKLPFFKDIKIFGLSQGRFASYTLINPVITSWTHDTYDYSQGAGVMQHTAEIQYEAVKYGTGEIGDVVKGFGEESRYDLQPGATTSASLFGQGGLVDSLESVGADLASGNIGGALKTIGTSATTFGSAENLANVVGIDATDRAIDETLKGLGQSVQGTLQFPSLATNQSANTKTTSPRKSNGDD